MAEAAIGAVIAALAENAATEALVAGAATAAGGVYQAQQANSAASKQRNIATQRAQIEQAGADAKYRQDRSLINRRLAQQIDAARVSGGASGVSGGASALVLESAYGQQANTDLAIAITPPRPAVAVTAHSEARRRATYGRRATDRRR